ncbi:MAG: DNA polymerase domain-containing protein [Halobacteria archaeon]|nr:DNA polymerase domain-containing protein [Halobacteria archaeon]
MGDGNQSSIRDFGEEPENPRTETETEGTEIGVTNIDYTVESDADGEPYPVVNVFGRTTDGEAKHVRVLGFEPYFYIPEDQAEGIAEKEERVTRTEDGYESIEGDDLIRVYTRIPADVGEVRESYHHYEADILFPNRFRIDKGVKSGIRIPPEYDGDEVIEIDESEVEPCDVNAPARTGIIDIEVEDRHGFPENGEEPIICLTAWDSFDDEYDVFVFDADAPDEVDGARVHSYETEEEMLDGFLSYVEEKDFDLFSGWNFNDFDAPYLIDRLDVLDLDSARLSRLNEVWHSDWGGPTVKGRTTFDLLYAYQRMKFTELESYRLDAIAEEELGESKVHYTGKIGDLWHDDTKRLLEYNKIDVELCVRIDEKVDIIDFFRELSRFVGCSLEDSTTPSDVVDIYVLRKAHGEFVLPSKGGGSGEEYAGGEVFEPITGIRENVAVLDLASLYPMSMVSINASPETKVGDDYDGDTYEAPNGVEFRKDIEGLTKTIVTELLEERQKKKDARDEHEYGSPEYNKFDNQQSAIKVVMNCFSGDTDLVTEDGVRNIKDIETGDYVYSVDPETKQVEFKEVVETYEYDYSGEMVDIETRHTDFSVTPNHKMLVETESGTEFVEASDLNDYTNYQIPTGDPIDGEKPEKFSLLEEGEAENVFVYADGHGTSFKKSIGEASKKLEYESNRKAYRCSPSHIRENPVVADEADEILLQRGARQSTVPHEFDTEDWLRLVGWYVTEGSVYEIQPKEYETTKRGRSKKIQFAQIDGDGRDSIRSLLERMGMNPLSEERQISVTNAVIADWLVENCGSGSENKRLPDFVFSLDSSLLEVLFDSLIQGDGDTHSGIRYSTKSDRLKDDMVRLAVHLGYKPMVSRDSGVWRIRFSRNKGSFRMHRNGSISRSQDGKVYCVTVEDNHTVLAGRDGKFQWVGQSYYGVAGYPRFRLYDREMGSAVTATGRRVIEHTRDTIQEMGYDVIYGDSVTGDRPVVVRNPSGRMRIIEIERLFETGDDIGTVGAKERRSLGGWEALSVTEDGEAEWKPINQAVRHKADGDVVRLQHKFGESTTTEDHSYVVDGDEGLKEVKPDGVDEPLRVPEIPDIEEIETVDVYEVLEGYEREYVDTRGGRVREKTKRVQTDGEYVWFGHPHQADYDSTVKVRRYIDIDSEEGDALLRLLGTYVAEGTASTHETSSRKYGSSISESDPDLLRQLKRDYNSLFKNATVSVIESDTRPERTVSYQNSSGASQVTYTDSTHKLQMMNELSAVFFREFAGQTSRGKRVPEFVFHLPKEKQDLFLNAVVDGDGSRKFPRYSEEYSERNFDYETTSRCLAAGISTLLIQRGKKHSFKYRDEKESYTIRTCDYYREGRDPVVAEKEYDGYVYDLSVEDNQNFVDGVGGIVLHNTDSTLVELGSDREFDEIIETGEVIEEKVNESYDDLARDEFNASADTHRWEIEFEKLYRRFFQAGKKKRYAGHLIWNEGKEVDEIDITGFEYKRSDVAQVTKDVQEEVIRRIVTGEEFDSVAEYLRDVIDEFKEGDFSYDYIGIPGGIGQKLDAYDTDTAQVKGAKYANEHLGTNFTSGSKPKRLYIKRVKPSDDGQQYPPTEVVCFEYEEQIPDEFVVDWDKMLQKTLEEPISRILEALGWSWSEVESGQEQTGLGEF